MPADVFCFSENMFGFEIMSRSISARRAIIILGYSPTVVCVAMLVVETGLVVCVSMTSIDL